MKALVVLGAAVWKDGPSPTLRRRCAHAARVWAQGDHTAIIVCGGLGQHHPTEAEAMADLLIAHGVPAAHIHKEAQSTTTLENLTNAREILRRLDAQQITIVTDMTHAPRARLVAKALGLRADSSSPPWRGANSKTRLKQAVREAVALPGYVGKLLIRRINGKL